VAKRIPRIEEQVHVDKHTVETGRTRVRKHVHERTEHVDIPLEHEDVEVQRISVNRPVDAPVATRQEGDRTVISVHREVTVVTRQLVVVEEIHITRKVVRTHAAEDVTLLEEEVQVVRQPTPTRPDAHPGPGR